MPDSIAHFALRGALPEELSDSLARCFAEYFAWHGWAMFLSGFAHDASVSGVSALLADRIQEAMGLAEQAGLLRWTADKVKTNQEIASDFAEHQLSMAHSGVKLAAIVILHNAYERFLFRLVRFGLVANRPYALRWIADRKVEIGEIVNRNVEELVDDRLEKWWDHLERDSLLAKWDKLVALVGHPSELTDGAWRFDRDMLSQFDDVRHHAVHHDSQCVQAFDFDQFANQLWRSQFVWAVRVAKRLGLQIPADVFFGLRQRPGERTVGTREVEGTEGTRVTP